MLICVYASASDRVDKRYFEEVEQLGEILAQNNHGLVYGGGSSGLMGSIARGIKKHNGPIVGVSPRFMSQYEDFFKDCTQIIETETLSERKQKMEDTCDAFVIVPGGIGTFDEFFECIVLKQLNRHQKPVVLFNSCGFYDSLIAFLKETEAKGFLHGKITDLFWIANTPEEVLSLLSR